MRSRADRRGSFVSHWSLDWILVALIVVVAPLVMGGRQPTGRLLLVTLIGALAAGWCGLRRRERLAWNHTSLLPLWLLGALLVSLQVLPLGHGVCRTLSPHLDTQLPLWNSAAGRELGLQSWSTLSLTPVESHRGLVLLVAYGVFFLVLLQLLRGWDEIRRALTLVAAAGALVAAVAVAQRFLGNGKFLWLYEHPYRLADDVVKGPFINENHLCGFLAIALPALIYLWQHAADGAGGGRAKGFAARPQRSPSATAWLFAIGLAVSAVLLTFSRGGVLAVGAAVAASLTLLARCGRQKRNLRALAGVGAVVVVVLGVYGAEPLRRQLGTISADLNEMSSARVALWQAVGKAIPNYLPVGAGVGAHRYIYPQHMVMQLDVELTHAENGYLQVLLETGVPGLLLLLTGWGLVLKAGWKVFRHGPDASTRSVGAVVLAAAVASLFHSLGDFVWYIPACMTLTLVIAAIGIRAEQLVRAAEDEAAGRHRDHTVRPPATAAGTSAVWHAGAVASVGLTAWMIAVSLPPALAGTHRDEFLKLSLEARKRPSSLADVTLLRAMSGHLERAVAADPHRARPRLRLASMRLKLFEQLQLEGDNPMPLSQLREAAAASRDAFGALDKQLEWLRRAVGDNLDNAIAAREHAMATLRLCPLQGEAYVLVAELEMLDSLDSRRPALLQQALRLRPHSGSVLFAVGSHFALQGDATRAVKFWRSAYHREPDVRRVLLATLAPRVTAQQFLDEIRPTQDMLGEVRRAYQVAQRRDDAARVAYYMARFAERDARDGAQERWKDALAAWRWAGDPSRAAICGLRAVKFEPGDYDVRKQLGLSLLAAGKPAAAAPHLRWCRQRRPHDLEVAVGQTTTRR